MGVCVCVCVRLRYNYYYCLLGMRMSTYLPTDSRRGKGGRKVLHFTT